MLLPENLERKNNKVYEEVNIPPSDPAPTHIGQQRIRIDQLDDVRSATFVAQARYSMTRFKIYECIKASTAVFVYVLIRMTVQKG